MKWIKKNGWLLLSFGGLMLIITGIACFTNPFTTYIRLVKYAGLGLLLNSLLLLVSSFLPGLSAERNWLMAKSVLDFSFALILCFNPFLTFIAFPLFSGFLIICSGLLKTIGGLLLMKKTKIRPPVIIAGSLFIVFGVLLMRAPFGSAMSVNILFGLFGLTLGLLYLYDSLMLRPQRPA